MGCLLGYSYSGTRRVPIFKSTCSAVSHMLLSATSVFKTVTIGPISRVRENEAWRDYGSRSSFQSWFKWWTWHLNLCFGLQRVTESESCSVGSDSLQPHGLYSSWNSPGQNTEVGSCSLIQGIFPTQGSNPGLPHCRWFFTSLSYQGSPKVFKG